MNNEPFDPHKSLISYSKVIIDPISKMRYRDIELRYGDIGRRYIAKCAGKPPRQGEKVVYHTYDAQTGKEICPQTTSLRQLMKAFAVHERRYIEKEIERYKIHDLPDMTEPLIHRLSALKEQEEQKKKMHLINDSRTHYSLTKKHTMDTQNEKTKFARKVPTEIEYHEKGQWTKGEHIITVMGGLPNEGKHPIGYITLVDYDENKKPILAALDLDGNEIFEHSPNLYQLKKQFRDQEERLTKAMLIKEGMLAPDFAQELTEEINTQDEAKQEELKNTRKGKQKDNAQSHTH